jgi:hypothetical protein
MNGIQVRGRSSVVIEATAADVRHLLMDSMSLWEAVDAVKLFEFALEEHGKELTGGSAVTYAVEPLPQGIEGYTQYDPDADQFCVTLSERTYRGLTRAESRPGFTVCHEVGHLALHSKTMKRLKKLPHRELMLERSRDQHKAYEDSEWQANRFASAMLMPALTLEHLHRRGRLDEEQVAHRYNTSYQAAQLRIRHFHEKRSQLVAVWRK